MTPFTTLTAVKQFLSLTSSGDDATITRLILSASGFVRGWISRDIELKDYEDSFSGWGSARRSMPNYPIYSVSSVLIDDQSIPVKTTQKGLGFTFSHNQIILNGYTFKEGIDNITIAYKAGFVTDESFVVPASGIVTVSQLWTKNVQVVGASLHPYTVDNGVYTFNVLDAAQVVSITYGYIPPEIEQATIDIVARKFRERTRVGEQSKRIGAEIIRFIESDLSTDTKAMLNQYCKVIPV